MSAAYFDNSFEASDSESTEVIRRFRKLTGNEIGAYLDTSDNYGPHTNERLVGALGPASFAREWRRHAV